MTVAAIRVPRQKVSKQTYVAKFCANPDTADVTQHAKQFAVRHSIAGHRIFAPNIFLESKLRKGVEMVTDKLSAKQSHNTCTVSLYDKQLIIQTM